MRQCRFIFLAVSCQVLATLSPAGNLAFAEDPAPRFEIAPKRAFYDEHVSVFITNLKPDQVVTVQTSAGNFKSELEFKADARGRVDLAGPKPDPAKNEKIAPLRILWSMKNDPEAPREDSLKKTALDATQVTISAYVAGKLVADGTFELLYVSADMERIPVREQGLRGVFFKPKTKGHYPGLMVLGGSDGGLKENLAALLARRGYGVLALAYFNYEDLPKHLVDIPLEYFETGLKWLQNEESIQGEKLAVLGRSRGGELALLLGTRYPQIKAVVAYVPSNVVWPGFSADFDDAQPAAWTSNGKPVANMGAANVDSTEEIEVLESNPEVSTPWFRLYLNEEEAARHATIPVEKIGGPVLLISGIDDQVWPSPEMAELVMQRMTEHKHSYSDKHLSYANCGHLLGIPNSAVGETRQLDPLTKQPLELGGTSEATAYASWDSWAQVLSFLDENLKRDR